VKGFLFSKTLKFFTLAGLVFLFLFTACENPFIKQLLEPKTVTFNSNGGSSVPSQKLLKDETVKKPADPKRAGYIFDGWFVDNKTFLDKWDFNIAPTEDMTLHAKWTEPYDLTFNVGNAIEWNEAALAIIERGKGKYLINIIDNFSRDSNNDYTFGAAENINVTIKGNYTISLSGTGSLLKIGENQTVTMSDVTLEGNMGNDTSLVDIDGGAFTMSGSAKVTGNYSTYGGGVYIDGGAFTMSGNAKVMGNKSEYGGGVHLNLGAFTMSGSAEVTDNSAPYGGGVYVGDTFTMTGGTVSGNTANGDGGGVWVNGGEFTMSGSAKVTGNTATSNGGGVYTGDGTFTMNGGTVSDNNAGWAGGGVFVNSGSGTFNMKGGTVSGNTADGGSGVYVDGGTLKMEGGVVSDNNAVNNGGGVFITNGSTFTMNGSAKLTDNTAGGDGGGVYLDDGTFTMSGNAKISNNETTYGSGGGVYVGSGAFAMQGGAVSNNTATSNGGGVYTGDGTFNMEGGSVTGNTAVDGGGVCVASGVFTVGGSAVISGNTKTGSANNVYLAYGNYITLGGVNNNVPPPTTDMRIYVQTAAPNNGVIVDTGADQSHVKYFLPDEANKMVVLQGDKLVIVEATAENDFYAQVAAYSQATSNVTINVEKNLTLPTNVIVPAPQSANATLTIKSATSAILTLTRGTEDSTASNGLFMVSNNAKLIFENIVIDGNKGTHVGNAAPLVRVDGGELTLRSGAVLRNNRANQGGGVFVNGGTFTMSGNAAVSGNTASYGGGVYIINYGTFTMTNGEVSGNTAIDNGGGVLVSNSGSTFTMRGNAKVMSENTAVNGGGVYIFNGEFTMEGNAEVSGNTANSGGGVCVSGTFTVGGSAVISGNTNTSGSNPNNVYLISGKTITLGNGSPATGNVPTPASNMKIWVQAASAHDGVIVNDRASITTVGYFESDDTGKEVMLSDNKLVLSDFYAKVAAYGTEAGDKTITVPYNLTLLRNVEVPTPSATNVTLTITSSVPGYTLTRGFQDTAVASGLFMVSSGAKLIFENIVIDGNYKKPDNSINFANNAASLVRVNGGELTLKNGAVLKNNRATNGGGVYTQGILNMEGNASVSGNTATGSGGGVYTVERDFNMEGNASVSGNTAASNGGGVFIYDSSFSMNGNTAVSGNTAVNGGGVYVYGTFTMNGTAKVSGNTATTNGGGVYFESGEFIVGSTAEVSGNKVTGSETLNNVYLPSGKSITLDTGTNAPTNGMSIGVRTATGHSGVIVYNGASDGQETYFHADDSSKEVALDGSSLKLVDRPGSAGITLEVAAIVNNDPSIAEAIPSLSKTGNSTFTVSLSNPGYYDTGSIQWRVAGAGATDAAGTGNSFTLRANAVEYGTTGGHTLELTVKKDGYQYMVNIPFTIVN